MNFKTYDYHSIYSGGACPRTSGWIPPLPHNHQLRRAGLPLLRTLDTALDGRRSVAEFGRLSFPPSRIAVLESRYPVLDPGLAKLDKRLDEGQRPPVASSYTLECSFFLFLSSLMLNIQVPGYVRCARLLLLGCCFFHCRCKGASIRRQEKEVYSKTVGPSGHMTCDGLRQRNLFGNSTSLRYVAAGNTG